MNLPDDDKNPISPQITVAMVMSACMILLIIVIVLVANRKPVHHQPQPEQVTQSSSVVLGDSPEPVSNPLTPEDLDFWSMYPEGGNEETSDSDTTPSDDKDNVEPIDPVEPSEDDLPPEATDGRHTLVVNRDGKEEWVLITPYLPKNDYDYTSLVLSSDRMSYYKDGKVTSYLGLCVDKYDDYVDFNKIKDAGIDFVMLRVGVRGYGTGTVTLDEYYADNISRASQAGLEIGLYFTSQATTVEEATEEALILTNAIADYNVSYPLAMDIGFVTGDTSRIESLTKAEKTTVIRAFMDAIKASGYTCALHADKEFLIKEIDLSKFTDIDIWLENNADLPDYPYTFTMWDYTNSAKIDGVSGNSDLTISFIDYTQK